MQNCDVNKREKNLQAQRIEFENKLKKMIKDKGGENNILPELVLQIKEDIEMVQEELSKNKMQQHIEAENNRYE